MVDVTFSKAGENETRKVGTLEHDLQKVIDSQNDIIISIENLIETVHDVPGLNLVYFYVGFNHEDNIVVTASSTRENPRNAYCALVWDNTHWSYYDNRPEEWKSRKHDVASQAHTNLVQAIVNRYAKRAD